jgi:3-deoxy-D-manno-octulosonate 8-phosphate phosphatase (KDO 8-P phosphatase)
MTPEDEVNARARRVRLLLMDVDGVLTDGKILFIPDGSGGLVESKAFHVTDGAGIALARRAGLRTGLVSRRNSPVVVARAQELGIEEVHLGVTDKAPVVERIASDAGIGPEETAYVGDDVVDLPAFGRVGFPVAVANAVAEVRARAVYVTTASGGHGAVREIVELILRAQGKWNDLIAEFLA